VGKKRSLSRLCRLKLFALLGGRSTQTRMGEWTKTTTAVLGAIIATLSLFATCRQIYLANRAWIGVEYVSFTEKPTTGKSLSFTGGYRNYGKSPAQNLAYVIEPHQDGHVPDNTAEIQSPANNTCTDR
jgi:hypothetical protein